MYPFPPRICTHGLPLNLHSHELFSCWTPEVLHLYSLASSVAAARVLGTSCHRRNSIWRHRCVSIKACVSWVQQFAASKREKPRHCCVSIKACIICAQQFAASKREELLTCMASNAMRVACSAAYSMTAAQSFLSALPASASAAVLYTNALVAAVTVYMSASLPCMSCMPVPMPVTVLFMR